MTNLNRLKWAFPILSLLISANLFSQTSRTTLLFNDAWQFNLGDVAGASEPGFADKDWKTVDLPHDWSIAGPYDAKWASGTAFLPGGIGWYRKTFRVPAAMAGKNIAIYFDGVYKNSEVWLNGHSLGKRPSGFSSFQYDLAPFLDKTGKNTLSVKVDHSDFADSRWYTGSGINRNVYLIATNPVHIGVWGVKFTTPQVTPKNASAVVRVIVDNASAAAKKITVTSRLVDASGKTAGTAQKEVTLSAAATQETLLSLNVVNPALWSTDHPNLYSLVVSIAVNGQKTDELTNRVGIRTYRFDKDKGFSLNQQSMKLKGLCIHDDAGVLGTAVPEEVWERRLAILKAAGCNALRLSHNPHADFLYTLMDKMGFLVMDEAFDEWEFGKNKWITGWNVGTPGKDGYHTYFQEWGERDLADMVKRDYNHPSIILWSIGNEVDYPNDPYSHEILNTGNNPQIFGKGYQPSYPPASRITGLAKKLVAVVKKEDTSRPVTTAFAGVIMSNAVGAPDALDIAGYNYTEQRYAEDHQLYPNRVIYGSENSMNYAAWKSVTDNAFISGQFLWTGIDYMGEAGRFPSIGNGAGLIDMAGFPKPEYYFRQSLWSAKPMVYITTAAASRRNAETINRKTNSSGWNYAAGDSVRINAFTNQPEAELFLNGKSLGKNTLASSKENTLTWSTVYQPGELVIKGMENGKVTATYLLKTADKAVAIQAVADKTLLGKGAKHLSQVEITLVDKSGNTVIAADNEMTVTVSGPGKLLGLENGSLTSSADGLPGTRKARNGKLLAYVQTGGNAGQVKVSVSAAGMVEKVVVLVVK